jgi:hypothetical protein
MSRSRPSRRNASVLPRPTRMKHVGPPVAGARNLALCHFPGGHAGARRGRGPSRPTRPRPLPGTRKKRRKGPCGGSRGAAQLEPQARGGRRKNDPPHRAATRHAEGHRDGPHPARLPRNSQSNPAANQQQQKPLGAREKGSARLVPGVASAWSGPHRETPRIDQKKRADGHRPHAKGQRRAGSCSRNGRAALRRRQTRYLASAASMAYLVSSFDLRASPCSGYEGDGPCRPCPDAALREVPAAGTCPPFVRKTHRSATGLEPGLARASRNIGKETP